MADLPAERTVTVELSDTDMTRFIHFASVVEKFEIGLRLVMEAADVTFRDLFDRGIGLPIVNVDCDYRNPMLYGDELTLRASLEALSEKTMTVGITLSNDGRTTAEGTLTTSFYDMDAQEGTAIPDDIRSTLQTAAGDTSP
jgi:YbgC/YbaW family acyl-CoA thioester hydrolase